MIKYLEEGELSVDEIKAGLRKGVISGHRSGPLRIGRQRLGSRCYGSGRQRLRSPVTAGRSKGQT